MSSRFWTPELVPSPQQTALFVAAASTPSTFSPSLLPRTSVDQGLVTGLSVGSAYVTTAAAEDGSRTLARLLASSRLLAGQVQGDGRDLWFAIGVDALLVPAGLAVLRLVPDDETTPALYGVARMLARRLVVTGVAGTVLTAAHAVVRTVDANVGPLPGGLRIARLPLGVPLGFAAAYLMDLNRSQAAPEDRAPALDSLVRPDASRQVLPDAARRALNDVTRPVDRDVPGASQWRSLAVAGAVVGGITGLVVGESAAARGLGKVLGSSLPGSERAWQRVARVGTLTGVGLALGALWTRTMHEIEAGASVEEKIFGEIHGDELVPRGVSGGPDSLVPWSTLGREGRRHVLSGVAPTARDHRALALERDSIENVTGQPPRTHPVQVYVGLDSAPTQRERVELALREMEQLGAFDRSLIVLVSPTGTGYVNYAALASLHYLTRGDVATVVMQYSKRPSPLSLGKVAQAREQNRLLWLEIARRLRDARGPRPRVVVFGESLGAHASQDVFLGWGTAGPAALGIERGLWIGTPAGSKWHHQVRDPRRIDVDPSAVGVFNDIEQVEALDPEARRRLRYVLLSHDDDGVTTFSPDLLLRRPAWLDPARAAERPTTPPGRSPRGLPHGMRWLPMTTFFQNLLDMSNAQRSGAYVADAHDYRPDLPRFVSEVFDLPVSAEVMGRIERAVQRREVVREQLFTVVPEPEDQSAAETAGPTG